MIVGKKNQKFVFSVIKLLFLEYKPFFVYMYSKDT